MADATQTAPARELVKHGDVMPYAKKSCKACFGTGEFTAYVPSAPIGQKHRAKLCGCALQRFMKARGAELDTIKTRDGDVLRVELLWKVGPELRAAMNAADAALIKAGSEKPTRTVISVAGLSPEQREELNKKAEAAGIAVVFQEG